MRQFWYVLQTVRNRERLAQAALSQRGLPSYVPRIEQWPRPAVGSAVAPMFPGYLFVHATLDDCACVSWTPGVKGFLAFGDGPAWIDAAAIDFLREREAPDGIIHCAPPPSGQTVRIVDGPFRGLTAVIERRLPAHERVRVLIQILRAETPVELPERWLRQA
jgi:transcription antitermination factor NusG